MIEAQAPSGAERPWRIVFFGSPDFSLPALQALHDGPDQVVLVVAPPPAPCGRGCKLRPAPLAKAATEMDLPLFEAKSVKNPAAVAAIAAAQPDLLVVAAYGGFLPPELLNFCPYPPLNIHPSLLPRHRGAAPVSWALIKGDREIGVSIIFLGEKMDAGPILSQRAFPADEPLSAGVWEERLARAGAEEMMKAIEGLKKGRGQARPQDEALASTNRLLRKDDGRVDFQRPAAELAGLINGVDPWPGARAPFQGKNLKLFGAALSGEKTGAPAGEVLGLDEGGRLKVACGDGGVVLLAEVQPDCKKRMAAADFICGYRPERLG